MNPIFKSHCVVLRARWNALLFVVIFALSITQAWAGKRRIVFFYIGTNSGGTEVKNGHTAACDAAKEQVEKEIKERGKNPADYEIILKNINDFSNLSSEELLRQEQDYIHLIKTEPEKYTQHYEAGKNTQSKMDPLLFETNFNLSKLSNFLEGEKGKPAFDVAVGAHWLIPLALAQAKAAGRAKNLKTGWMFTDYYENPLFPKIANCIDMTFLGATPLVDAYASKGVRKTNIVSSGIPISPEASKKIDRKQFLMTKGLDPDPNIITITLAGGGEGLGDFPTIIQSIRERYKNTKKKIQIVAITAKNKEHFTKLTRFQSELSKDKNNNITLKVEGTVPSVDMLNYVKASHLYIVKSGGLSPTEGAVIGTPMVLLDVLGGHERDNAKFYQKVGIGVINQDPRKIGEQVFSLLNDEAARKKMLAAQGAFRKGRDFNQVAKFALNEDLPGKNPCWEEKRSPRGETLLKEVGLDERNEKNFLAAGWKLLENPTPASLKKAEAIFKKAALLNPTSYAANYMLAHVASLSGNPKKAIKYINRSLAFDPSGSEGQYFHRGIYHLENNNIKKGVKDLLKALSIQSAELPTQRDKDFNKKIRNIIAAKLPGILDKRDLKAVKKVFTALVEIEKAEAEKVQNLQSQAPLVLSDDDCTQGDDSVCMSGTNLERSLAEVLQISDQQLNDEDSLAISPPLKEIDQKLGRIVARWLQKQQKWGDDSLVDQGRRYLNVLGDKTANEKIIYEAYLGVLEKIYPPKNDPFVESVRNYSDKVSGSPTEALAYRTQAADFHKMVEEYSKKVPDKSRLKPLALQCSAQAKEYATAVARGNDAETDQAYKKLVENYDALLSQYR